MHIQHPNNQPIHIVRLSDNPHFPMSDNHFQIGNISSRAFPQPSPPLNVHDGGPLRFIGWHLFINQKSKILPRLEVVF